MFFVRGVKGDMGVCGRSPTLTPLSIKTDVNAEEKKTHGVYSYGCGKACVCVFRTNATIVRQ